jgi:hypothetical protein
MEITYTIEQFVYEIREKYKSRLGTYPSVDESDSAIQHWIDDLNRTGLDVSEYRDILSGIDVTQFGNLALFHYADFSVIYGYWNPEDYWNAYGGIYRTCRSTVIDLSNGETVIKPFDKFFNIGELPETSIDTVEALIGSAKEIEISNKLDGSIFCVSRRLVKDKSLNGYGLDYIETNFCTSQSLNPETSWHLAMGIALYRKDTAIQDLISNLPLKTTLMFEMITKEDAHVVYYPSEMYGLHLIGARTDSGDLLKYSEVLALADKYGVKTTEVYDKTFSEVFSSLDEKKSDEAEGFVIRIDDRYFKLKYNDYVQVHKTINRLVSASGVIEAFRDGKIDDLISKVPATYKDKITEIVDQIVNSEDSVRRVQQIAVRKCFGKELRDQMLWIQKNIPKILQGRCINAVKYKDFGLFSERSKGVLKLSGIKEIGTSANGWLKKQQTSEYEMVYGSGAKKISDCEGEFFNFGERHTASKFNSEEFSV